MQINKLVKVVYEKKKKKACEDTIFINEKVMR